MMKTDDIDLILTLNPHGWSTCRIFVDGKNVELIISHVFGDPYSDFLRALTQLIDKQKETTFFWYGEPGGERIEIKRNKEGHNIINVCIDGFQESFEEEIKDFENTIEFEIKEKAFITISYLQLKKVYLLLKDESYAQERRNEFPFREFNEFELKVKKYLEIK